MTIATYDPPYNLKDRRESLSLDQGPAEEIIGAKGLVKAGLMAPTGGSSSEPEEPFVGKQPEFEGLSEKEKAASWELEKLAYKSKLEKLSGIVDDMDEDVALTKSNGSKKTSQKDEIFFVEKPVDTDKKDSDIDISNIEEATSLSGLSPSYLTSHRQTYVHPADKEHETTVTFNELFAQYNGLNAPTQQVLDKTVKELERSNIKVSKSIVPNVKESITSVRRSIVPKKQDYFNWDTNLRKMIIGGEADSYNTVSNLAKSKPPKKVTSLTVGELKKWMEQEKENTASGLYQINLVNLNSLIDKKVINEGQLFDKNTQDKAYNSLLEKRGFSTFKAAMKNPNLSSTEKTKAAMEMQLRLAKEWASIPIPYDLTKEQRGKNKDGEWIAPNGLKAGMSYYESNTNSIPKKNKELDFLKYLLSYTEEKE